MIEIQERDGVLRVRTPFDAEAVAHWKRIPGRRWVAEVKCNEVPSGQRRAVWALLLRFYYGEEGVGPRGPFKIEET